MENIVVLDLGGVLASETSQIRDVARRLGVRPDRASAAYWKFRDAWDAGCSAETYWRCVGEDLDLTVDDATVAALTEHDISLWTSPRPGARAMLDALAESGNEVWLLSNAAASFEPVLAASDWGSRLTGRVISGVEQLVKPEDAIYHLVESRSGHGGPELLYVDDRPENLVAPRTMGWRTLLWKDDASTRAWLVDQGVLAS